MEGQHVSRWSEAIFSITTSESASKQFFPHFEKIIRKTHPGCIIMETVYDHNQFQFDLRSFVSIRVIILRVVSRLNHKK